MVHFGIMALFDWHKRTTEWFQEKLNISDYGMLWFASLEGCVAGVIVGLLICKLT